MSLNCIKYNFSLLDSNISNYAFLCVVFCLCKPNMNLSVNYHVPTQSTTICLSIGSIKLDPTPQAISGLQSATIVTSPTTPSQSKQIIRLNNITSNTTFVVFGKSCMVIWKIPNYIKYCKASRLIYPNLITEGLCTSCFFYYTGSFMWIFCVQEQTNVVLFKIGY